MRTITLTKGKSTVVDDEDFETLSAHSWHAVEDGGTWYAYRSVGSPLRHIPMHRDLLPDAVEIDHQNGDGLDNRRANLRPATHAENQRNSRKRLTRSGRPTSSRFKGVYWDAARGKWAVSLSCDGRRVHGGRFIDEAEAAHEYDRLARRHFGAFARPNFSSSQIDPS